MAASAPLFPIEETTIAALHAAYLSGRATAHRSARRTSTG